MEWLYATLGVGGCLLVLRWLFSSSGEVDDLSPDGTGRLRRKRRKDERMRDVGVLGGLMGGEIEDVAAAQFALRYRQAKANESDQKRASTKSREKRRK